MIYVVQEKGQPRGPVKIGTTSLSMTTRMAGLSREYGVDLRVLATFPGGRKTEKAIHVALADRLVRGREWFAWSKSIVSEVKALATEHNDGPEPDPRSARLSIRFHRDTLWNIKRAAFERRMTIERFVTEALRAAGVDLAEGRPAASKPHP